jgi:hypothetical protein
MKLKSKLNVKKHRSLPLASLGLASVLAAPVAAWGCACGCGVFDVGTSTMLPDGPGGNAFVEYDYQDQFRNWSGNHMDDAANNNDRQIETSFTTYGLQYQFNRTWGAEAEIPYWFRSYQGWNQDPAAPTYVSRNWSGLGDLRLKGYYTGFSPDMASGLTFGLKLPTGSRNRDGDIVDRDTQIGSGSTDALLGGYTRHQLNSDGTFTWFTEGLLDVPFLVQDEYRPGLEADLATGIYYHGFTLGRAEITPLAQVIGSWRGHDSGAASAPNLSGSDFGSGYQRVLLSPGLEVHVHPVTFYTDVELPVYINTKGDQLVAPILIKASLSYMF